MLLTKGGELLCSVRETQAQTFSELQTLLGSPEFLGQSREFFQELTADRSRNYSTLTINIVISSSCGRLPAKLRAAS